ncbi:MAG TPA: hypothetical protein VFC18_21375 [Burkholderiales bacterium]|nr:hypothetical protein [Burkholderiales bacterium]
MRSPSPLRVPLENRKADARKAAAASALQKFGATLQLMMAKLERNWPLSMAVLLVAIIVAAHV